MLQLFQMILNTLANYIDLLDDNHNEYELEEYEYNRHRYFGNRHRNRAFALNEVNFLNESEFLKLFRMNRQDFENLLNLISPFMDDSNEGMATRSSGSTVTIQTKLYVTLRWLAGGQYQDLCFAWGISSSLFYRNDQCGVIWPIMEAINDVFDIGIPFDDMNELNRSSNEFSTYSHGELLGCVTAIDGWVAKTRKPFRSEVTDVMAYRNRHDCWGLVVLAGCDARCNFTMFSCVNSGSTNDTIAWELSEVKRLLDINRLPNQFYLIGDEAFQCTNQLLVPYSGRGLGVWKDSFNFHLSVMRQCIERSFALLVQRWGILWRPLRCRFNRWTLVLTVCAKLHNYTISRNTELPHNRFYEDQSSIDEYEVILNSNDFEEYDYQASHVNVANRRTNFTRELELKGIRRPNHAFMNSRA